MARKPRKLKLGEAPSYPSDSQAKEYLRDALKKDPLVYPIDKWFRRLSHSPSVDILITAGSKNTFFLYAYPAGGITIKQPEDIEGIQLLEAWGFEYLIKYDTFNTLVKLSRDGDLIFWQTKHQYKP